MTSGAEEDMFDLRRGVVDNKHAICGMHGNVLGTIGKSFIFMR
jgi:hypothetical protein